jgi:hypothetical protein
MTDYQNRRNPSPEDVHRILESGRGVRRGTVDAR